MKILMINGQNHKGSSYHIGRMLSEEISSDISEVFLPGALNHFCMGCCSCITDRTSCPYYDDKKPLEDLMEEADLLVFTTPTYCLEMSAPLKAFFDLFFTIWITHCPKKDMFKKKAVVITTSAGAPTGSVLKPVVRTLKWWGIPNIYKYGIAVSATSFDEISDAKMQKIKSDINRISDKIKRDKIKKPSLFIRMMFGLMGKAKKDSSEGSYDYSEALYWREQGWLSGSKPWN